MEIRAMTNEEYRANLAAELRASGLRPLVTDRLNDLLAEIRLVTPPLVYGDCVELAADVLALVEMEEAAHGASDPV